MTTSTITTYVTSYAQEIASYIIVCSYIASQLVYRKSVGISVITPLANYCTISLNLCSTIHLKQISSDHIITATATYCSYKVYY